MSVFAGLPRGIVAVFRVRAEGGSENADANDLLTRRRIKVFGEVRTKVTQADELLVRGGLLFLKTGD
jgi:hypothetical protein